MKKKEEILDDEFTRKWGNSFFGCAEGYTGEQFAQTAYPLIQKSMQTYADQECAEQKEKIEEQFVIELMAELNRIGVDTTKWDGDEDLVGTTAYCIKMAIEDERDKCASLREQLEAANNRIDELESRCIPNGYKLYKCTDCLNIDMLKDNGEIAVGFCSVCQHPLWND